MKSFHIVNRPTTQREFAKQLMKILLMDIDTKWNSDIKDTDIVTVFKRTLVRNLQYLKGDMKKFCKMTQKMNNR